MITCRDCGTDFPKPTTRGRPPVKCVNCRSGSAPKTPRAPKIKSTPVTKTETSIAAPAPVVDVAAEEAAEESLALRRRRAAYKSGFCGITVINHKWVPHPRHIHALCRGKDLGCNCKCHEGVNIWGDDE